MRYNVFDLYDGSVRGERLKEVALKLDYAKPSKGGVNGNEDIDEARLLSGLIPSILSLLKFEVKFKNMDQAPISELIQDVNFKNAIFNVAVNAARLEKLFGELKQLYFKEQEITKAIGDLKALIEKEKQTEKEKVQQDANLRQQIEAQNQDLQRMLNDYIKQREDKIKALEDTIKELNTKQRELMAYDKKILKDYSARFANTLDNLKNDKGEPILGNLSKEQKNTFSEGVFDDFFKIERKYDKKIKPIDQRIAEIDKELSTPQNGHGTDKSSFNKGTGVIGSAFQLHTDRHVGAQKKNELEAEKKDLQGQKEQLLAEKEKELDEAVIKNSKNVGKDVSEEDAEKIKEFVKNDEDYKEQHDLRNAVHDEVEVVQELKIQNAEQLAEAKKEYKILVEKNTESVPNILKDNDDGGLDDAEAALLAMMGEEDDFSSEPEEEVSASLRAKN